MSSNQNDHRIAVVISARVLSLSRSSLYRGFDRYLHRTPQSEILRVQMETARTLLRETNLLVSSIGLRVGFTTPEYFVRAFRRENGITPNEYRKKMLYGNGNDFGNERKSSKEELGR